MHVELPIGAFTATLLVLVSLPWHWRARNVSTLSIGAWLFLSNLIYGVNSIVWSGHARVITPIWCDIATKFQIGVFMALPSCCLCLATHLERISSIRIFRTVDNTQRQVIYDVIICWLAPITYMILHFIIQSHRFDIVEDFGCRPAIYSSIPAVFIIWLPPLLVTLLTLIYAAFSLRHFFKQRLHFARHLQISHSNLTTSQYFRLVSMIIVIMFLALLTSAVNIWLNCHNGLHWWTGWNDVHSNFSRIEVFPTRVIPTHVQRWMHFTWWFIPISSLIFFAFSFGEDTMKEYKSFFYWVARTVYPKDKTKGIKKLLLPSFNQKPVPQAPKLKVNITFKTEIWREEGTITPRKEYFRSLHQSSSFVSTA